MRSASRPKRRAAAPKKPPRARLDVDERRAQLLAVGLAAFSARSYDEVSIDELARAAGVSKGLFYHYFPTKRDLYVAALGQAAQQLLDETMSDRASSESATRTSSDPRDAQEERLRRGLTTYLDFVERHAQAYAALMRGGIGSDPEVAALLEKTRGTFATRLLEDVPHEAASPLLRAALRGWIGFVEATSLDWAQHPGRAARRDELVALLSAVLFDVVARATGARVRQEM